MSWENVEVLNNLFEKLTDKQKLKYFEDLFGEQLGYLWRDWDENQFKEEINKFKDVYGVKND